MSHCGSSLQIPSGREFRVPKLKEKPKLLRQRILLLGKLCFRGSQGDSAPPTDQIRFTNFSSGQRLCGIHLQRKPVALLEDRSECAGRASLSRASRVRTQKRDADGSARLLSFVFA
jgi:hypothetical protein